MFQNLFGILRPEVIGDKFPAMFPLLNVGRIKASNYIQKNNWTCILTLSDKLDL